MESGHSSQPANLENNEAVCAQATGPGSRILVSPESCMAKAVAGNAGGIVQPTHRNTVPRARDQIASHWTW